MTNIIKEATEYKQKSSNTMYVISFLFGLLIIIAGYTVLKIILEYLRLLAVVLIIGILSIIAAMKI